MPAPIRLVVRFTPFPPGFSGDLSKYNRALIDRIEVLSPFAGLQWQIGGIKPTSNVGPWLNDLGQPFVWDETTKDYIPMDMSLSLADVLSRLDALEAAGATYDTPAARDAAIAAAVGGIAVPSVTAYPVNATKTNQVINVDGALHTMQVQKDIDPQNCFNNSTFQYTAPVAGFYRVSAFSQIDNGTGDETGMEISIQINRNGTYLLANGTSVASPPGQRWYPSVTGLVQLAAGDIVEADMEANDGVNSGNITVSNFVFSIELVQKIG